MLRMSLLVGRVKRAVFGRHGSDNHNRLNIDFYDFNYTLPYTNYFN